jgi:hypothetical protein
MPVPIPGLKVGSDKKVEFLIQKRQNSSLCVSEPTHRGVFGIGEKKP